MEKLVILLLCIGIVIVLMLFISTVNAEGGTGCKNGEYRFTYNGINITQSYMLPIKWSAVWEWNGSVMVEREMSLLRYATIVAVRDGIIDLWRPLF